MLMMVKVSETCRRQATGATLTFGGRELTHRAGTPAKRKSCSVRRTALLLWRAVPQRAPLMARSGKMIDNPRLCAVRARGSVVSPAGRSHDSIRRCQGTGCVLQPAAFHRQHRQSSTADARALSECRNANDLNDARPLTAQEAYRKTRFRRISRGGGTGDVRLRLCAAIRGLKAVELCGTCAQARGNRSNPLATCVANVLLVHDQVPFHGKSERAIDAAVSDGQPKTVTSAMIALFLLRPLVTVVTTPLLPAPQNVSPRRHGRRAQLRARRKRERQAC